MIIPKLHYISQGNSSEEHLENIQKACSSGLELVQLCLKNVSEKEYLKSAIAAREITSHFQTRLIINEHYKIAKEIKADGIYLGKKDSCPVAARAHLYTWQIIGAAASTLQDCETLIGKEVDYICLGPFRSTTALDNLNTVLGLSGYVAIIEALKTETPIIGIGDITTKDITAILETGISGIAVSNEITRDFNSVRIFNQLLKTSSIDEQRYTIK
jgi:thiamine-phosphate pyrophosphorylase